MDSFAASEEPKKSKKLVRSGVRSGWCAVHFYKEIERRFFDAESTDADASINRGF